MSVDNIFYRFINNLLISKYVLDTGLIIST